MNSERSPLFKFFDARSMKYTGAVISQFETEYERFADFLDMLPDGAEKTVALRKLLESKDAALRALQ